MIRIWEIFKTFFTSDWLEHHLFYFFLLGLCISIILGVFLIIREYKRDVKNKKETRKREKRLLKNLSTKKNKTY
jgi:uncharacterized membrane-anchored protein YhcB (DUF1043 family)